MTREADLPFYLGVRPERRLSWWARYQRRRALRRWLRERGKR